MAIDVNSYSSVADVEALTRHISTDGGFDVNTTPTLLEVESIIDDCSALLNVAIAGFGFNVPVTQADAKRACDLWVRAEAVALVEGAQRATGFDGESNTNRAEWFRAYFPMAKAWVEEQVDGWTGLGLTQSNPASDGLAFTGLLKHSERSDPKNTTYEQPRFRRRQWGGRFGI